MILSGNYFVFFLGFLVVVIFALRGHLYLGDDILCVVFSNARPHSPL